MNIDWYVAMHLVHCMFVTLWMEVDTLTILLSPFHLLLWLWYMCFVRQRETGCLHTPSFLSLLVHPKTCLNVVEKLSSGDQVTEEELVILGQLPDINTTSGKFYSVIRSHLLSMRNDPVISLLKIEGTGPSLEERFMEANSKDSAEVCELPSCSDIEVARCLLLTVSPPPPPPPLQDTAHLLHGILTAQITPTFHKVNIHAAMTPGDIQEQFKPVFSQANFLKEAYKRRDVSQRVASGSPRVPFVTVSFLHYGCG